MKQRRFMRFLGAALSAVFLATNVVFAHVPETSVWAQRRRPAVDALAPILTPPILLTRGSSEDSGLPLAFGSVRHLVRPAGTPVGTVIHIQDVHSNLEAQRNISAAIRFLAGKGETDLVALEGAFGPVDVAAFRAVPDRGALRRVADFLLTEDAVSGAVHAALNFGGNAPALVGVDDSRLYRANVDAYRRAALVRAALSADLDRESALASAEKSRVFGPALSAADAEIDAFEAGRVTIGDHARRLLESIPVGYPTVRAFAQAAELEGRLDLPRIESERAALLSRLAPRLSPAEIDALARLSVSYRSGDRPASDLFGEIFRLCAAHRVSPDGFPALVTYIRYLRLSDGIDGDALHREMTEAGRRLIDSLALTNDQRALVARSRALAARRRLLGFSLTRDAWEERGEVAEADPRWTPFLNFYRAAEARDAAMAENILSAARQAGGRRIVLVTGGFHARGVQRRLVAAGYEVIDFVPKVTTADAASGSAYLSVFTQRKTPLEQLFSGRPLFLARPVFTPIDRVRAATALTAETALDRDPSAEELFDRISGAPGASFRIDRLDVPAGKVDGRISTRRGELDVHFESREAGPTALAFSEPRAPGAVNSRINRWLEKRFGLFSVGIFEGAALMASFAGLVIALPFLMKAVTLALAAAHIHLGTISSLSPEGILGLTVVTALGFALLAREVFNSFHLRYGILGMPGASPAKATRAALSALSGLLLSIPGAMLYFTGAGFLDALFYLIAGTVLGAFVHGWRNATVEHAALHSDRAPADRTMILIRIVGLSMLLGALALTASRVVDSGLPHLVSVFGLSGEFYALVVIVAVVAAGILLRIHFRKNGHSVEDAPVWTAREWIRGAALSVLPLVAAVTVGILIHSGALVTGFQNEAVSGLTALLAGLLAVVLIRKPSERGWASTTLLLNGIFALWFVRVLDLAAIQVTYNTIFFVNLALAAGIVAAGFRLLRRARSQPSGVDERVEPKILLNGPGARAMLLAVPLLDWLLKIIVARFHPGVEIHIVPTLSSSLVTTQAIWALAFALTFVLRAPLGALLLAGGALASQSEMSVWGGSFNPIPGYKNSVNLADFSLMLGAALVVKDIFALVRELFRGTLTPFMRSMYRGFRSVRAPWSILVALAVLAAPHIGGRLRLPPPLHPSVTRSIDRTLPSNGDEEIRAEVRSSVIFDILNSPHRDEDRLSYVGDPARRRRAIELLSRLEASMSPRDLWRLRTQATDNTVRETTLNERDIALVFARYALRLQSFLRTVDRLEAGRFDTAVLKELSAVQPRDFDLIESRLRAGFEPRWKEALAAVDRDFGPLDNHEVVALASLHNDHLPVPHWLNDEANAFKLRRVADLRGRLGAKGGWGLEVDPAKIPVIFSLSRLDLGFLAGLDDWLSRRWNKDPDLVRSDLAPVVDDAIREFIGGGRGEIREGQKSADFFLQKELDRRKAAPPARGGKLNLNIPGNRAAPLAEALLASLDQARTGKPADPAVVARGLALLQGPIAVEGVADRFAPLNRAVGPAILAADEVDFQSAVELARGRHPDLRGLSEQEALGLLEESLGRAGTGGASVEVGGTSLVIAAIGERNRALISMLPPDRRRNVLVVEESATIADIEAAYREWLGPNRSPADVTVSIAKRRGAPIDLAGLDGTSLSRARILVLDELRNLVLWLPVDLPDFRKLMKIARIVAEQA